MIIKQVRLSQQAKDQLSRLKGKTGIKNWNILCRWALCYSLSEKTLPTDIPIECPFCAISAQQSDPYRPPRSQAAER